ncbi:MAG: NAD-dependent epimerase/dehydratase family protein [Acidimicrobiaceae bacterium]|nr:NAD-dependent epimerase/dehydratase family protein [Acidimicrobiaceae bacterium]
MLQHKVTPSLRPTRVVVIGAGGFVGRALVQCLEQEKTPVIAVTRQDVDLLGPDAEIYFSQLLTEDDSVVFAAAEAPCKDPEMLIRNIAMMTPILRTIQKVKPRHVVYLSSDAVYLDSDRPLNEQSPAAPGSLHGAMHLSRELMIAYVYADNLCIVRPTLIYGDADPHNGYGPNRFRRLVAQGKEVILFGDGEEKRDHVSIDDVAELLRRIIWSQSVGILNIATGTVLSFREIAQALIENTTGDSIIGTSARFGPMPHNGYRAFDPTATYRAFPDFQYRQFLEVVGTQTGSGQ